MQATCYTNSEKNTFDILNEFFDGTTSLHTTSLHTTSLHDATIDSNSELCPTQAVAELHADVSIKKSNINTYQSAAININNGNYSNIDIDIDNRYNTESKPIDFKADIYKEAIKTFLKNNKNLLHKNTSIIETTSLDYFFQNSVTIPSKIEYALKHHVSVKLLKSIDIDIDIAIDKCIFLCSLILSLKMIVISYDDNINERPYTCLPAKGTLTKYFGSKYKKVLNVLLTGTKKFGPIIECDMIYATGGKSFGYRFTDAYYGRGFKKYTFKTCAGKGLLALRCASKIDAISNNKMAMRIVASYKHYELPTEEEIILKAKELKGTSLKNGKILTFRGTNSSSKYKKGKYSFVEDSIELFKILTDDGFLIPTIGDEKSGGRIYDSFTTMPSWIRAMIKINGLPIKEYDYTALHPNIAIAKYGTPEEQHLLNADIHTYIANKYNVSRSQIKKENLSFFNKRIVDMKKSFLYEVYQKETPVMLKNLITEKEIADDHCITSRTLFATEVQLMKEVICQTDFPIIYVFDAIYSVNTEIVTVMNTVAKNNNILTLVA
jgi:hypothetical protein